MNDPHKVDIALYAVRISRWALFIAAASLITAISSFLLDVRRRFNEGVRLSLSVMVEAKLYGGNVDDENSYISIIVTNRGNTSTTLTNMVLYDFPGRFLFLFQKCPRWLVRSLRIKPPKTMIVVNPGNQPLPHVLESGHNWYGRVVHDPVLIKMIDKGGLYVGVLASHSNNAFLKSARRIGRKI